MGSSPASSPMRAYLWSGFAVVLAALLVGYGPRLWRKPDPLAAFRAIDAQTALVARTPEGTGPGTLQRVRPDGTVAWSARLPGQTPIWSATWPTLFAARGLAIVETCDQTCALTALSLDSGRKIWSAETKGALESDSLGLPLRSPEEIGGVVLWAQYTQEKGTEVMGFDLESGAERWRVSLGPERVGSLWVQEGWVLGDEPRQKLHAVNPSNGQHRVLQASVQNSCISEGTLYTLHEGLLQAIPLDGSAPNASLLPLGRSDILTPLCGRRQGLLVLALRDYEAPSDRLIAVDPDTRELRWTLPLPDDVRWSPELDLGTGVPFSGELARFVPVWSFSGDSRSLLMLDLEERTVAWQSASEGRASLMKGDGRSYAILNRRWVAAFDDHTGRLVTAVPAALFTQRAPGALWVLDQQARWRALDDQTLQPIDGGLALTDLAPEVRRTLGAP